MKTFGYQIGNFVKYKDNVIKIEAVHQRKIGYHTTPYKLTWVRVGNIEPIKITLKFLQSNFNLNESYTNSYGIDDKGVQKELYFTLTLPNDTSWNIIWVVDKEKLCIEDACWIDINYIHELQNIMNLVKSPIELS